MIPVCHWYMTKKAMGLKQKPEALHRKNVIFQKYEDKLELFELALPSRKKTSCLKCHENHSDLTCAKKFRDLQYQINEIPAWE